MSARSVGGQVRESGRKGGVLLPVDNLSLGGAFLRTRTPMPVGTQVVVELTQKTLSGPLGLVGAVVLAVDESQAQGRMAPGMAVRFDPLHEDALKRLSGLLKALAEEGKARNGAGREGVESFDSGLPLFDETMLPIPSADGSSSPQAARQGSRPRSSSSPQGAPSSWATPPPPPPRGQLQAPIKKAVPLAPAPSVLTELVPPAAITTALMPPAIPPVAPVTSSDVSRMATVVKAMLENLDETREELVQLGEHLEKLAAENARLEAEGMRKDLRIAELEAAMMARRPS